MKDHQKNDEFHQKAVGEKMQISLENQLENANCIERSQKKQKNYPWFMVKNVNFVKSLQYKVDI